MLDAPRATSPNMTLLLYIIGALSKVALLRMLRRDSRPFDKFRAGSRPSRRTPLDRDLRWRFLYLIMGEGLRPAGQPRAAVPYVEPANGRSAVISAEAGQGTRQTLRPIRSIRGR